MSKASIYFTVDDVSGKHDVKQLKSEIGILHGVLSVSVNDRTERIAVDFDTTGTGRQQIRRVIEHLGYQIREESLENHVM